MSVAETFTTLPPGIRTTDITVAHFVTLASILKDTQPLGGCFVKLPPWWRRRLITADRSLFTVRKDIAVDRW